MIYEEPQPTNAREVLDAISRNDVERLLMIPIELGLHHEDWRFVQDISVKLLGHKNAKVRANALFGIEYSALFRGQLDQQTVEPALLRALHDNDPEVVMRAEETVEEVNRLMGWHITP